MNNVTTIPNRLREIADRILTQNGGAFEWNQKLMAIASELEASAQAPLDAVQDDAKTLTDEQIIAIRKRTSPAVHAQWSDTLAFARAIISAVQKASPQEDQALIDAAIDTSQYGMGAIPPNPAYIGMTAQEMKAALRKRNSGN